MSATAITYYGSARITALVSYAAVVNLISYAIAAITLPVPAPDGEGVPNQLIDGDTGALLYDSDTGAAITF